MSLFTAVFALPGLPPAVQAVWALCTLTLVGSLALTACTDPGIVRRTDEPPLVGHLHGKRDTPLVGHATDAYAAGDFAAGFCALGRLSA